MKTNLVLLAALAFGCSGEADDGVEPSENTWCCEVKASDGNTRFSRNCELTEEDAISWMRDPNEICWDDADTETR